jgi:predicted nucleotidyltransferase
MISHPNIDSVRLVAQHLGPLREELVFVGGCATALLATGVRAQEIRMTIDVDLVAQVTSQKDYRQLERQFESLGFTHDLSADAPICRWRKGELIVDLMPSEINVLGFANRWYPLAMQTATTFALDASLNNPLNPALNNPLNNPLNIKLIAAPEFIGTKLEAFKGRGNGGNGDYLSHDLEDIITIVDTRATLQSEIDQCDASLREYLQQEIALLLSQRRFVDALPGFLLGDAASQQRLPRLYAALKRIAQI